MILNADDLYNMLLIPSGTPFHFLALSLSVGTPVVTLRSGAAINTFRDDLKEIRNFLRIHSGKAGSSVSAEGKTTLPPNLASGSMKAGFGASRQQIHDISGSSSGENVDGKRAVELSATATMAAVMAAQSGSPDNRLSDEEIAARLFASSSLNDGTGDGLYDYHHPKDVGGEVFGSDHAHHRHVAGVGSRSGSSVVADAMHGGMHGLGLRRPFPSASSTASDIPVSGADMRYSTHPLSRQLLSNEGGDIPWRPAISAVSGFYERMNPDLHRHLVAANINEYYKLATQLALNRF